MNAKKSRRGGSLKNMQMFELAEELGMTLEELVGPKRASLYPRNMREVEFLRAIKKATPLQKAAVNAILVGSALGYLNDAVAKVMSHAADPLAAILEWCETLMPEQRAAMEARAADDDARNAREFAEAQAEYRHAA